MTKQIDPTDQTNPTGSLDQTDHADGAVGGKVVGKVGDGAGKGDAKARHARRGGDGDERLEISLEHMRWRHAGWAAFGLVAGALLLWKLGTVGQWLGVALVAVGAFATYGFLRTVIFSAGTIIVDAKRVTLPRGLCRGKPMDFERGQVEHVYLLRRAVPWTRAAPVLVVEAGGKAFSYPRDWFASEADQRRIIRALHRAGKAYAVSSSDAPGGSARPPASTRNLRS